jgi:hypothetical protein
MYKGQACFSVFQKAAAPAQETLQEESSCAPEMTIPSPEIPKTP